MTAAPRTPRTPTATEWIAQGATFETSRGHRISHRRRGSGPILVMLHGFPTWSYDYAALAADLATDHDIVTLDFLGYGASAKPRDHTFSVAESADTVEELLAHLGIARATLVIHDYGAIVGQELLDRRREGALTFGIDAIHALNFGVVYSAYRPTLGQRLLATPVVGRIVSNLLDKGKIRRALDGVRGAPLTDAEFDELWVGMSREDGHTLAHRHIRYNAERAVHHRRWESAWTDYDGPRQLVWGTADPVSGQHVLDAARPLIPDTDIVELDGVGHFPQSEAPEAVARAIRRGAA